MQYNCNEILLLTVDPKNEKQTKKSNSNQLNKKATNTIIF